VTTTTTAPGAAAPGAAPPDALNPYNAVQVFSSVGVHAHLLKASSAQPIPYTDPRADDAAVKSWREQRLAGLGGTDMAVVCGLSPYGDPLSLWLEKTGQREPEPPDVDPERLGWGHFLEPPVADEFSRRTGLALSDPGETLFRAPEPFGFLQGSPDRLIVDGSGKAIGLLEIKTTRNVWPTTPPPQYLVQVLAYAICLNLEPEAPVYIAALHMADAVLGIHQIDLRACLPAIPHMLKLGRAFWDCVEQRIAPLPAKAEPRVHATLELPIADGINPLERYSELKDQIALLANELDAIKADCLRMMGTRRIAVAGDWEAIQSTRTSSRFDRARFEADHPGMLDSYQTSSTAQMFSTSPIRTAPKRKRKSKQE